ncbi:MAG: hypothetical protein B6242_13240 [Anaerolineaceae bacterium 4572_78]|nr:MAG: hypothetical protein B6242_13240 [Anaerolineaceae bacterium 4572_78]
MKKVTCLIILLLLTFTVGVVMANTAKQDSDGELYIVQAGDWLSKIAEKYYGDVLAYHAIVDATNAKAETDSNFILIVNPDMIEIGQRLWIPTKNIQKSSDEDDDGLAQFELEGSTWVLVSYGKADNAHEVITGTQITVSFTADKISGSASCNNYSASFSRMGNELTIGVPVSTRMACSSESIMKQEMDYLGLLESVERYHIQDGRMQIFSGPNVLNFVLQAGSRTN